MVWGSITMHSKTDLIVLRSDSLTAQRYINLYWILRQTYLRDHQIQTLPWPACSRNLNPIEHLWDQLGRAVKTRPNPPITIQELEIALLEEWQRIPQDAVLRPIRSMPHHGNAVLRTRW